MRSISKKSNLDRLKQQVQQTSNQQYQIQMQKDELEQTVACKKQELMKVLHKVMNKYL